MLSAAIDMCGEVPDGDLHSAGDGQAGSGAGAAHQGSVPDPNPDPHVFLPPGSGSGSFYHHAKIIRKTLNPTIW
jgi:hypothetical protein